MSYFSIEFVLFLVIIIGFMTVLKDIKVKNYILLVASYIFYAWADIRFLSLLFFMSLFVWIIGKNIENADENRTKKTLLTIGIGICLATLVIFKYYGFFLNSFRKILHYDEAVINIAIPLGISFYSLQAISYLADVYKGKISHEAELYKILLYIGFFPQIVSGPIVKARDFLPQIDKHDRISKERVLYGIQLIIIGILKKKVIADRLSVAVDSVYCAPKVYSGLSLLVVSIGYAIQIYCDFSGYSDISIGVAHILGFDLGVNFDMPYIAENPSEFWKRWHISLSSWFKEYVYIPLGGNRHGRNKTYLNIIITMLLSGLWHGTNWTFAIWGLLHGIWSILSSIIIRIKHSRTVKCIDMAINTIIVWILWIPFRAPDVETAIVIIKRIILFAPGITYISVYSLLFGIIIMTIHIISAIKYNGHNFVRSLNLELLSNKIIFTIIILIVMCFGYIGDTSFIYANF